MYETLFNLKVSGYHHTSLTLISCISCKCSLYKKIYIHMYIHIWKTILMKKKSPQIFEENINLTLFSD